MSAAPVAAAGAAQAAARERAAIDAGVPPRALMQRAGAAAAGEIARRHGRRLGAGVAVYAGTGNNGGDAWVVAGALAAAGVTVRVVAAGEPRTDDARAERAHALSMLDGDAPSGGESVVVDGLLGTGAAGALRGRVAELAREVAGRRAAGARVVALDLPSGLDATTGAAADGAVTADLTVTFGTLKRGLLVRRDLAGRIAVVDIGLGAHGALDDGAATLADGAWVGARVAPLAVDAHKGTRGRVAVVGGAPGMAGAAALAARGALRAGAGLVRVVAAPASVAAAQLLVPEALAGAWPDDEPAMAALLAGWADAALLGPGLGGHGARALAARVLAAFDGPVVLDADALNAFAGDLPALATLLAGRPALLTPHPLELARLAGAPVEVVLARRFEIGGEVAAATGAVVLLKGVPTTVAAPSGATLVVARGTPALATGGSGDVLGGIAAALLAQGLAPADAGACAAWAHGRAAELAGAGRGARGIVLDDVLGALGAAWDDAHAPPTHRYPGDRRAAAGARMIVRRAVAALALAAAAACAPVAGGGLGAPEDGGLARQADRVLVGRATDVLLVAAGRRHVYAATGAAILAYDPRFGRWLPALDAARGVPAGRPTALAWDPLTDGAWAGWPGAVAFWQPDADVLVRTTVGGVPDLIAFDRRNLAAGALVRAGGQWLRVSSAGGALPVQRGELPTGADLVIAPGLRELEAQYPAMRAFERLITRDAQLRSFPLASAARSPEREELWLGTLGGGLFRVDAYGTRGDAIPYGLLTRGAGPLARAADGVWTASDAAGDASRGGLSFVDERLERFRWVEPGPSLALAGIPVRDVAVRGGDAWLATARGVVRLDLRSGAAARWDLGGGLADDDVRAVAARDDGAWVGTRRGVSWVPGGDEPRDGRAVLGEPRLPGADVRALLAVGDTLWAGTAFGLFVLDARGPGAAVGADPRLRRGVVALAASDTLLVAATDEAVVGLDVRSGRVLALPIAADARRVAPVRAVDVDADAIWVAGARGVLVVERAGGAVHLLAAPGALPGLPSDVLLAGRFAWVATAEGLVRVRRAPGGGPR